MLVFYQIDKSLSFLNKFIILTLKSKFQQIAEERIQVATYQQLRATI